MPHFLTKYPKPEISISLQCGGGICYKITSNAISCNIGFSKIIITRNKTRMDECDFLYGIIEDKGTVIIAIYIENIINV